MKGGIIFCGLFSLLFLKRARTSDFQVDPNSAIYLSTSFLSYLLTCLVGSVPTLIEVEISSFVSQLVPVKGTDFPKLWNIATKKTKTKTKNKLNNRPARYKMTVLGRKMHKTTKNGYFKTSAKGRTN